MLKQMLIKIRSIIVVLLSIVLLGTLIFMIAITDKNNYYLDVENKPKNLNTSLLNNVYIINDEQKEEVITEKINNVTEKELEKTDFKVTNDQVEPASTVVQESTQPLEDKQIDNVYVGLTFTGSLTAYGKDCCGSDPARQGITSSGYDLKESLTYNDSTYGKVRIIASDKNFKLYSIIKINDPIDGIYNAIVLDRAGSVIGLNKTKKFDLAVESEQYASSNYGVHRNVIFEVLRVGK